MRALRRRGARRAVRTLPGSLALPAPRARPHRRQPLVIVGGQHDFLAAPRRFSPSALGLDRRVAVVFSPEIRQRATSLDGPARQLETQRPLALQVQPAFEAIQLMNGTVRGPFTGLLRRVSPPVGDLATAGVDVATQLLHGHRSASPTSARRAGSRAVSTNARRPRSSNAAALR